MKVRVDYRYGSSPTNKTMSRTITTMDVIDASTVSIMILLQGKHPGRKIEILSIKPA